MKFSKRSIIGIGGGVLLAAGVAACHSGHDFGTAEERGEWMVQKVSRELGLDANQRVRLEAVKDEMLDLRRGMRSDREQTRADVLAMLQQPTLDRARANAIVAQYVEAINAHSPRIIDAFGGFYDSLDTEQRSRLTGAVEKRLEHHYPQH